MKNAEPRRVGVVQSVDRFLSETKAIHEFPRHEFFALRAQCGRDARGPSKRDPRFI